MIREPKMLPWLAKKAGVPLPVAEAIWQEIAATPDTVTGEKPAQDLAWRQVRALRLRLKTWEKTRQEPLKPGRWVLPVPVYRAWAGCQTRVFRNTWLAWARAARTTSRLSHPHRCG